jgi:hypothetical protein
MRSQQGASIPAMRFPTTKGRLTWVNPSARGVVSFLFFMVLLNVPLAFRVLAQSPFDETHAQDREGTGLWGKSALGGQLGPWFSSNLTGAPADTGLHLTANSTAFHLEFFYQPHLTGIANLDVTVGAVSRGEMAIRTATEATFGTATIYPIGVGLRLAPLAKSTGQSLQPLVTLGGTVLIGTEQYESAITFPNGTYYGTSVRSHWGLGFYGGAGVAWVLGDWFALSALVKYQHARFTKAVFGARDYSGIQVLFGGMYLYRSVHHKRFKP